MNSEQRHAIELYAKEQMAKLGLHGWPHVKRVQRLSMQLLKSIREADSDVVEAASLLHDVGKYIEKENSGADHGRISAEMAEKFLNSVRFNAEKTAAICHAIRVHTHGEEPRSVEAKILHDADFLDKTGAVGVATLFIKACLTNTTIEESAELWKKPSRNSYVGLHASWLQKPHYYTKVAGTIAEKRNKLVYAFFMQLEKEIALKGF